MCSCWPQKINEEINQHHEQNARAAIQLSWIQTDAYTEGNEGIHVLTQKDLTEGSTADPAAELVLAAADAFNLLGSQKQV